MRLLHTSDWHLGQTLHDLDREYEHSCFLAWLIDTLDRENIDAVVVAGDVFDTATPPASAERAWYGFLATLMRRFPLLDVVVIGGNHDSALRLDAPAQVLAACNIHVVGGIPAGGGAEPDHERLLIPLGTRRPGGRPWAWVAAIPYLRAVDLPALPDIEGDELIEGVRALYATLLGEARTRCGAGQALIATGHCYMAHGQISELSERKILGGNLHALPVDVFPPDLTYVALGHLHRAQTVGGREEVRYSGSPLPLAVDEASYRHQVLVAEIQDGNLVDVRPLFVPRAVDILRLPRGGPGSVELLMQEIQDLEPAQARAHEEWPYLEVRVVLSEPRPDLRTQIQGALSGRAVRLVRIAWESAGDGRPLAERETGRNLAELDEESVFRALYEREHGDAPPSELLAAFHEVREAALRGEFE